MKTSITYHPSICTFLLSVKFSEGDWWSENMGSTPPTKNQIKLAVRAKYKERKAEERRFLLLTATSLWG